MRRILIRVDFNEPLKKNGALADNFRIRAHVPEIRYWLRRRAQVILISHLEFNKKIPHFDAVHRALEHVLGRKVAYIPGKITQKTNIPNERVVLLDNLRLNAGEKKNEQAFARLLSSFGDVFVNDAFAVAHRNHASVVGIPRYLPSRAGLLMKKEIKELSRARSPQHPFLAVIGGKKFKTKEPTIGMFLKNADCVFVGGEIGITFLNKKGISKNLLRNKKIVLPRDFAGRAGKIYDHGPKTAATLESLATKAKFILWNGTLGLCEGGFTYGTREFAKAVGKSKAYRIAGGGDTVAAIRKFKMEKNFDFLSTGGGAMLQFLARGTLPGIAALKKK